MNILSCYFGRHNRGCWKRLKSLLIYFANNGHKVRIISFSHDQELIHSNITQVSLSFSFLSQSANDLLFIFFAPIYCFFITLRQRFDQLIAFDGHNAFCLSFAKLLNKNANLVLLVRGHPLFQNKLNNYRSFISRLILLTDRFGHKKSDSVIYNSSTTANSIRDLYNSINIPSEVVYNDCKAISPLSNEARLEYRKSLGISEDKIIIGFAGQLITRKNIGFLIDVFSRIKNKNKSVLLIKGNGQLKVDLCAKVENLTIQSRVYFLPWDHEMPPFYHAIDVFVLPSLYDDCSNSLLEAMSQNCCVLASDRGGNVEIMNHQKDLLFSIEDEGKDLLQKLDRLVDFPEEMTKLKAALFHNRQRFTFHWEEEIKLTIDKLSTQKVKL